jgi:hypothetical protein
MVTPREQILCSLTLGNYSVEGPDQAGFGLRGVFQPVLVSWVIADLIFPSALSYFLFF